MYLYLFYFPTTVNGGLLLNMGFLMVLIMFFEFFTGLLLSFSICGYNVNVISKLEFLNDLFLGWITFKLHVFLPNIMAFLILLHVFKCLFNIINSSKEVMLSGLILLFLFVGVSYTGYSLSKGAMGYWAVVVVNNLFKEGVGLLLSSSLFFEDTMGPTVETFIKVFTYHFLLAGLMILLQGLHIFLLHISGSSNFITSSYFDYFSFSSLMFMKDLFLGVKSLLFMFYIMFISYFSMLLGENFLEMNEFKSLELSVEWYVSVFFMILSGVCYKGIGMVFTLFFMMIMMILLFISDLFSFECFKSYNFYLQMFTFSMIFIYLSYFGFSSYLNMVSLVFMVLFCLLSDMFFIKQYLKCVQL